MFLILNLNSLKISTFYIYFTFVSTVYSSQAQPLISILKDSFCHCRNIGLYFFNDSHFQFYFCVLKSFVVGRGIQLLLSQTTGV